MMAASTASGPRKELGSRWSRLCLEGDENYELWETKFLAQLCLLHLKGREPPGERDAELIQPLDDKSLSLVMREAVDGGRKALKGHEGTSGCSGETRSDQLVH